MSKDVCINRSDKDYIEAVKLTSVEYVETYWLGQGQKLDGILDQIKKEQAKFKEEEVKESSRLQRAIDRRKIVRNNLYKETKRLSALYEDEKNKKKPSKAKQDALLKERAAAWRKVHKENEAIKDLWLSQSVERLQDLYEKDLKYINDIWSDSNATRQDVVQAMDIAKTWDDIGNSESGIIFNEDELDNLDDQKSGWRTKLAGYKVEMGFRYNRLVDKYDKGFYKDQVAENFKETLNEELASKITSLKDVGKKSVHWLKTRVLNISESSEIAFQTLQQMFKRAFGKANEEIDRLVKRIDTLFKDITPEQEDLFRQTVSNTDNRETGNLTGVYTTQYYKDSYEESNKLEFLIKEMQANTDLTEKEKAQAIRRYIYKYRDKSQAIEEVLDPNILFRSSNDNRTDAELKKDRAEHKAYFVKILGNEDIYDRYFAQLEEMVYQYKIAYDEQFAAISEEGGDVESAMKAFRNRYSPFLHAKIMKNKATLQDVVDPYNIKLNRVIKVAKRFDEDGRSTNYYDNKFVEIQNNAKLKEAYWETVDIMKQLYNIPPKYMLEGFNMRTIPNIEKTFTELFTTEGTGKAVQSLWDKISLLGATNRNEFVPDPEKQEAQLTGVNSSQALIDRDYTAIKEEYIQKNGKPKDQVSREKMENYLHEAKLDIQDKYAKMNNSRLSKVMKGYAAAMTLYKHKAAINDSVRGLHTIVRDQLKERQTQINEDASNTSGFNKFLGIKKKRDRQSRSLEDMLKQLDHTMATLYGYNTKVKRADKNITKVKASEKALYNEYKKLLENLNAELSSGKIELEEYQKRKDKLIQGKNSMEFELNANTLLDSVNNYIRLRGIGWNIFSGTANIGFGVIANWTRAADGRVYNQSDLAFGYRIIMHSMAKSITGNLAASNTAKKLRNIIDVWDFMKKSKHEIIEKKTNTIGNKLETFSPWNLMERGEYMNQGPVVAAILRHNKVNYKGKEISLWDLLQQEGGLPEDVSEEIKEAMIAAKISFDRTISRDHGNYDPELPLTWDKTIGGRLLKTFRTWMPQAYYTRFGEERPSLATGTIEKGRWRSWVDVIGNRGDEISIPQRFAFIGKQVIRKLYTNTEFDMVYNIKDPSKTITPEEFNKLSEEEQMNWERRFSEVDAANMRANITELYMMISSGIMIGLLQLAISSMFDDDDEYMKRSTLFTLNVLGRMQTDLYMWLSPVEFERVLKEPVPITKVIVDGSKLMNHLWGMLVFGDNDRIERGPYADMSRSWRYLSSLTPGLNAYKTFESLGISNYKN